MYFTCRYVGRNAAIASRQPLATAPASSQNAASSPNDDSHSLSEHRFVVPRFKTRGVLDVDSQQSENDSCSGNRTSSPAGRKLFFGDEYGVTPAEALRADVLWKDGHSGKGVRVAVFDTGLKRR